MPSNQSSEALCMPAALDITVASPSLLISASHEEAPRGVLEQLAPEDLRLVLASCSMSLISLVSESISYLFQLFSRLFFAHHNYTSSTGVTVEPHQSNYRLDSDSSDTFTLPDGRKLGYAQYGSLTGRPILYLHGLPGSRLEAAGYDELGLKLGARIIATDRPGIGWSSPHPSRSLLDFPRDLERLAEHLKLDEYSVMGVSGGGPYALACAKAMPPEKLKGVSLVCGLGPPDIGMSGAGFIHRLGFPYGWRYSPACIMRSFLRREPAGRLDWSDEKRLELTKQAVSKSRATSHPKDVELLSDEGFLRLSLRSARESYAQGFDGVLLDGKLVCTDIGFRVEDIHPDLPVHMWYGRLDTDVPLNHGLQIAARLGGRATLRLEDETHGSISQRWKKEQLEALLQHL